MDSESTTRRIVWLAAAFEGGLALLALGLGWLPGVQAPLPKIHWIARDAAWGIVGCLPLLVIFFICVRWPVATTSSWCG